MVTLRLREKVIEFCRKNALLSPRDKIIVGVSGGPDSICLLHLLKNLEDAFNLTLIVAHLNHQLRDEAQEDEYFVQEVAGRWGLPFFSERRDIARLAIARKKSVEETARQTRYNFLWRVAEEVEANKIAVGHNADDQAETVLMHFLRGTGLAGLRGMAPLINISALRLSNDDPPVAPSPAAPKLIRPLLATSRAEIETYCHDYQLRPRQDVSNQDAAFFRNRLRHELMPQLETFNPNIRQILGQTAKIVAADFEFLTGQIEKTWADVTNRVTSDRITFDLNRWLRLPLALKRSTLRRAVHMLRRSLRDISFEHIEQAIAVIEKGQAGQQAALPQGVMVAISYDSFTVADQHTTGISLPAKFPYLLSTGMLALNVPGVTHLPHTNWRLRTALLSKRHLDWARVSQVSRWEIYLNADVAGKNLILRTRRPGDLFYPFGMEKHSKKVGEFMIDEKIPADQRDHIPLLVGDDQILWICGYRPDERVRLQSTAQRILYLKFEEW